MKQKCCCISAGAFHIQCHSKNQHGHLDFVVSLTWRVSSIIQERLSLLMSEHIPDAQSFPIFVPGSFCLIGWTAGAPRKSWQMKWNVREYVFHVKYYLSVNVFNFHHWYPCRSIHFTKDIMSEKGIHLLMVAYHLEKCHNRRSRGCSLTSRSPQPQTDTTPAQAHDTLVQHGVTASYSRSQLQLSDSHQHHTLLMWEVVTLSLHIIHCCY